MKMWSCEDRDAPFVEVFRRTATRAGYDLTIIEPRDAPSGFAELKRHYRHLSPNPERFELASFRRWYEIGARVAPEDRFVLADSDLVIGQAFDNLPAEVRDAVGLAGSIGATADVLEDGINGGFSLWTGRLLHQFCEWMTAVYQGGTDELAALHAAKVAGGNVRASISDMVLLFRFVMETGTPFLNTNRLFRDAEDRAHYIDHNFFMPEAMGVRFAMTLGRKAVRFGEGFRLMTRAGEPVIADSLHLGGRYKIMAEALERGDQRSLAAKSLYVLGGRAGRTGLARLGIQR